MDDHDNLTKRRRRLAYRANHRGIKEMDIILGRFGDKYLETMEGDELDQLENLMEQNDRDLLQWFTDEKNPPDEFDNELFEKILIHAKSTINAGIDKR
jgi:antitoxin CptB